jgi:hypothetical protein
LRRALELARGLTREITLADAGERQLRKRARGSQRLTEVIALGGMNERVRGKDRLERRAVASRGIEDPGSERLDAGGARGLHQRAQTSRGESGG